MSFKSRIRVLAVCLILEAGVLMHCPMRPEEIEEIMHRMNQPKLMHVLPSDEDDGDGPSPDQTLAEPDTTTVRRGGVSAPQSR